MEKDTKSKPNKVKIIQPIRGTNWNDYYVGEKSYYQYGLTEQDVMKNIEDLFKVANKNKEDPKFGDVNRCMGRTMQI